jgi:hypothetical protein
MSCTRWIVINSHVKYARATDYLLQQISEQTDLCRVILVLNGSSNDSIVGGLASQRPGDGPIRIERR